MKSIKKIALASGSAITSGLMMASSVMAIDNIQVSVGTGYANDFGTMFSSILNMVMLIAAVLVFAFLIMGGIEWITSGGDKGKAESARNKLTAAVIGLVIIAASYAIVQLVLQFLGFSGLQGVFDNVRDINTR